MAISTYAELQTAVANTLNRTDMTTRIPEWIALAEAAMQTTIKLMEFEASSTITITSGVGTLPTGFVGMRTVYWDGSPDRELRYVTPELYDYLRANESGDAYYYTISGATIRTTPMGSGSIVGTTLIRFTPLATSPTNAILTNFPDAYLYGSCLHGAVYLADDAKAQKFGMLFNAAMERINANNDARKYAGQLQVRAR